MDFDALRAAVVPGAAVVGRWPGVVCVAECADRHVLRQLLDVCASSAGPEPGRTLARRLAMWLSAPDAPGDGLRFGTVAVTGGDVRGGGLRGEQWAVFLYGSVGLVVPDRQVALSGAQSVAWTDRLLPRPDAPVVLALEGGPIPPGLVDGVHDLRVGIVPGAGAVLVPGGDPAGGDAADETAHNRPDDSRWLEVSAPERPRWAAEPVPSTPPDGLGHGPSPGNGVPPRGSLEPPDSGYGGYDSDPGPERSIGGTSGRAHLRPVPSGSNGVAHHDWAGRRGSALDVGRFPEADQRRAAGPAEDDPPDAGPSGRADHLDHLDHPDDEQYGPEIPAPGTGDEHAPDVGRPRNGVNGVRTNGARTNGASHGPLGGPEAPARESERSPWSDGRGRDASRQDRIEGWFATPDEPGTESDLSAVGPAELRRRRHGRPEDDAPEDGDAGSSGRRSAVSDAGLGTAVDGDHLSTGDELDTSPGGEQGGDTGDFGSGSGDDLAADVASDVAADSGRPPAGEELDGSGDGTPRLGVPRAGAPAGPDHTYALPQTARDDAGEQDAPHTTMLRSERILGVAPGEPERPELEDGLETSGLVVDDLQDTPQVQGYLCARGHLNDPRVQFCALCGARMDEQTGPPTPGPLPPLGLLVFDDGATYTVDAEYLMGRMPEADPRVTSGALRSLALEDASGAVSRVHAQIVVHGWDALIVDAGSRNGTFVSPPDEQGWTQLPAGETHRLVPGTRVRIGGRNFLFESPSGAH